MVHAKLEAKKEIDLTGTGGLTVGDWVEVLHDFSAGHNSGGGVGVIIEIIGHLSNVRYIVDSHVEKLIPLTRLTTIPMPYRREKAKLRTRSEAPSNGTTMIVVILHMSFVLWILLVGRQNFFMEYDERHRTYSVRPRRGPS
jgi:hypothetical protein